MKRVCIVGGGFGGLKAAKTLGNQKEFEVLLIDKKNHHLFQPLLYQVATAGLNPADIAMPIRTALASYSNVNVLLSSVEQVQLEQQKLETSLGPMDYDYLILACGSMHSYFGHSEWEDYAPGLKSLEQATEIRRRVLLAFEKAEMEKDPAKRKQLLTFIIVGGGPTGVELAGALGEITRYTLKRDFRQINPRTARIILVEAGPRVLGGMDPRLSHKAMRDLERLGVMVWTESRVSDVNQNGVHVGEEFVKAGTVLWAAGVEPARMNHDLGVPLDRQGRVIVNQDLSIPRYSNAFVIGDQACFTDDQGQTLPGLAPVALQQGRWVAQNLLREQRNQKRLAFQYRDKGNMATIGRAKAVAMIGRLRFTGLLAWLMWLFVHIYYLIGFKNRVMVFWQWAWSYLTYRRGARLIVNKNWKSFE